MADEAQFANRVYLAATAGPMRAPWGNGRAVIAAAGDVAVLSKNATKDRVLFVAVQFTAGVGNGRTVFANNSDPNPTKDQTVTMSAQGDIVSFLVFPGEELWLKNQMNVQATYSVKEVTF